MTPAHDLVLLHGALGASSQLDPLAEALQSSFRIHRLDFEGHAGAPPRDRPFRIASFTENVIGMLDARGVRRARFFGYSMGGYVALHLASHFPERAEAVATLGTKFRWDPQAASREAARLDPDVIRAKVPRFADTLAARHEGAGGWDQVLARTAEFLRDLGERPVLTDDQLASITQPVRIVVGERDNTVSVDESESVATLLPRGGVAVLSDTPHPIEQVDAAALAGVLREFFLQASGGTVDKDEQR